MSATSSIKGASLSRKVRTVLAGLAIAAAACVATGVVVAGTSANAATTVTARYSPLGATANGPSGPGSALFSATPYCCPSTAVVLTPSRATSDADLQWMELGLPWDHTSITSVKVCYAVQTAAPGTTYINQTRLTDMTTPNSATVLIDNGGKHSSTTGTCYTVKTTVTPTGAVTLALRVTFGSASDRITIGLVALTGNA
jgi:hypothetical protein